MKWERLLQDKWCFLRAEACGDVGGVKLEGVDWLTDPPSVWGVVFSLVDEEWGVACLAAIQPV